MILIKITNDKLNYSIQVLPLYVTALIYNILCYQEKHTYHSMDSNKQNKTHLGSNLAWKEEIKPNSISERIQSCNENYLSMV